MGWLLRMLRSTLLLLLKYKNKHSKINTEETLIYIFIIPRVNCHNLFLQNRIQAFKKIYST